MRTAVEVTAIVAVAALTARRLVLLAAALAPRRPLARVSAHPSATVVVAARNEAAVVDRLLAALEQLRYPGEQLSFALVGDGCTDGTVAAFQRWAAGRPDAHVVELSAPAGKAAALNAGLALARGELVVTLDADLRPHPDAVSELVPVFADRRVGAASMYLEPVNGRDGLVARYAALTSWVHQLVTSAGAERLGLNPPTLGAAAYRRSALEEIGGFPAVPVGVDIATSRLLTRHGWRTRFVPESIVDNRVVSSLPGYWHQHIRWARGSFGSAGADHPPFRGTRRQRLESWASRVGYGDRLVFAAVVAGAFAGALPWWLPAVYLLAPGAEIVAATFRAGAGRELPHVLAAAAAIFPLDLAASLAATLAHAARRPHRWHSARGAPEQAGVDG